MSVYRKLFSWPLAAAAALLAALAAGVGLGAALGAPHLGAIVLGELSATAVVTAFTLLIWAAIQDGKIARELAR